MGPLVTGGSSPQIAVMAHYSIGALSRATGVKVLEALTQVNAATGATTLVITHNAAIERIADRTVRFADGRLVEDRANPQRVSPAEVSW